MLKSAGISTIFRIYRLTYILTPLGSFWSIFEALVLCLYQGQNYPIPKKCAISGKKYQEQTLSYSWCKRHQLGRASSHLELDSPSFKKFIGNYFLLIFSTKKNLIHMDSHMKINNFVLGSMKYYTWTIFYLGLHL